MIKVIFGTGISRKKEMEPPRELIESMLRCKISFLNLIAFGLATHTCLCTQKTLNPQRSSWAELRVVILCQYLCAIRDKSKSAAICLKLERLGKRFFSDSIFL